MKKILLFSLLAVACTKSKSDSTNNSGTNYNNSSACVTCTVVAKLDTNGQIYPYGAGNTDTTICAGNKDSLAKDYIVRNTYLVPGVLGKISDTEIVNCTCVQ